MTAHVVEPRSVTHPRCLLAATILASAMVFIDGIVVTVALPVIQSDFQASFDVLQWVINAYALVLGALILMGGALGDRHGRRHVFLAGIAVFTLASVACALAPGAGWLIGARAVQGLGGALLVPQSLAIIAAAFPKETRGRAVGIWAAAAALTTVSGPIVGGLFIDVVSWRAVFWINLPLALLAVWLTWRYVPESRGIVQGATDWLGGGLMTAGLALVIYAATQLPERPAQRGALLGVLAAGVIILAGFLRHEARSATPLVPLSIFRSRVFSAVNGITVALYFALSMVFFLLPYTLIQVHGYSGLQAGTALVPFGIVMGTLSPLASKLGDKCGLRAALALGPGLSALACAALALLERPGEVGYWSAYFPALLLLAVGMTISVSPLTTAVLSSVPDEDSGIASGINNATARVAGVFAVAAAGLISLTTFPHYLVDRLARAGVDDATRQSMLAGASRLADLPLPADAPPQAAAMLKDLVFAAYIDSYRAGMWVATIAAVIAACIAWYFLPARVTPGLVRK
jgi:EmrB/QacA subfamily drug resistance transporter